MGLDMYLHRMPRWKNATAKNVCAVEGYLDWLEKCKDPESKAKQYTLKEWNGVDENDIIPESLEFYRHFYTEKFYYWDVERKYGRRRIIEQVGYWRKANQIHNWFVENIQDGVDDCDYHREITKADLEKLLAICNKIKDIAVMEEGSIVNGHSYKDGQWTPMFEDGAFIVNADEIETLLPTQSGCFFGSTGYDTYYMQDIETTIEIITEVLETTDFDIQMIYYVSSW